MNTVIPVNIDVPKNESASHDFIWSSMRPEFEPRWTFQPLGRIMQVSLTTEGGAQWKNRGLNNDPVAYMGELAPRRSHAGAPRGAPERVAGVGFKEPACFPFFIYCFLINHQSQRIPFSCCELSSFIHSLHSLLHFSLFLHLWKRALKARKFFKM